MIILIRMYTLYYIMSNIQFKNNYVENKNYIDNPALDAEYLYVPLSQIVGDRDGKYEHHDVYDVNAAEYYTNFPPVSVTFFENKYYFADGFHRVNFCKMMDLDVPAVIVTKKVQTHSHEEMYSTASYSYTVFDEECQTDLSKSSRIKCKAKRG